MNAHLTILGASTRAASRSARHGGFSVFAGDLFGDTDLLELAERVQTLDFADYPRGFTSFLESTPQGTPWIFTGGIENYPALVAQWEQLRPSWGTPSESLRRVRDPFLVQNWLSDSPIRYPALSRSFPTGFSERRWLKKSLRSAGGLGVCFALPKHNTCSPEIYFQQHLEGVPLSACFLATETEVHFLGATQQLIGFDWLHAPKPFHYCGNIGPIFFKESVQHSLQNLARTIAQQGSLWGLFGLDLLRDFSGRLWLLEVNPRYTAGMEILERVNNLSFVQLLAQARYGQPIRYSLSPPSQLMGKAILYAPFPLTISRPLIVPEGHLWADLPPVGSQIEAGQPILSCFAQGRTVSEMFHHLKKQARFVEQFLKIPSQSRNGSN